MLWPGTIIYTGNKFPNMGLTVYALLAAGGDFGSAVAPQVMGIVADKVSASEFAIRLSQQLGITAEQIGIRAGVVISALFPLCGIVLMLVMKRYFETKHKTV
jgi:MFS family permease